MNFGKSVLSLNLIFTDVRGKKHIIFWTKLDNSGHSEALGQGQDCNL